MALDLKNVEVGQEQVSKEEAKIAVAERAAQVDPKVVGSFSDKVELVATLADPSRPDKSFKLDKNGKKIENVIATIVGYQFKAHADIEVPDVDTTPYYKSDIMDYSIEAKQNTRKVKKGEVFNLTHFETAKMLSNAEFNGAVTAGKFPAVMAYTTAKTTPEKRPDDRLKLPVAYLRAEKQGMSIRDLKQIPVLEVKNVEVEGKAKKVKTPIAGFEKWAPLSLARAATPNSIIAKAGVRQNVLDFQSLLD